MSLDARRSLALLVGVIAAAAAGGLAHSAPLDPACAPGQWILDGADARPGPGAIYKPEWQPILDRVVTCLAATPTACLGVRGQYDAAGFGADVSAAFGTPEAVQLTRARGRAEHIISRLNSRGVAGERLRLLPPPMEPTWRGVALTLVTACRPAAPPAEVSAPVTAQDTPEITRDAAQPAAQPAARPSAAGLHGAALRPTPERASSLALTAQLGAESTIIADRAQWGGRTRLGLEWTPAPHVYTHLTAGLLLTEVDARAVGGEVTLAADGRPLPWLGVGLYGAVAQGSTGFTEPWMQRTWSAGLEVVACLEVTDGTRLCATPRFAPLGERTQRYVLDGDDVFLIPQETDRLMSVDLAVGVIQRL